MKMDLKPRTVGAIIGFALSLLFIIFNWKVVISLTGLSLAGYILGLYLESGQEIRKKFKELFSLLFR